MTNTVAIALTVLATQSSELKTNVAESPFAPAANTIWINGSIGTYWGNRAPEVPPAKEKWVTTIVTKEDRLALNWMERWHTNLVTSVVSSNTVHLRVVEQWEAVK